MFIMDHHLGLIWEDSGEASGGIRGSRRLEAALEAKVLKTIVFYRRKWRERPFRVDGSDLTLTISAACAQKLAG